MKREFWTSRTGFVLSAAGSAVGLVNIWRFPYVVSENGGIAFIAVYLLFLLLIGFPVLISEVLIGRTAGHGPARAFKELGGGRSWQRIGRGITATGFIVSSFYAVVAGWILGYLVEALKGGLSGIETVGAAEALFNERIGSPFWVIGYQSLFMLLAVIVLFGGVRRGIEFSSKLLLPILFVLLIVLAIRGVTLAGGEGGLISLLSPNWSALTPMAILTALGHAFFTLSLGQGTMMTYGSYLSLKENLPRTCAPVVGFDTLISLIAAVAVLSILAATSESSVSGPGLLFYALPAAFVHIPWGGTFAILFFALVLMAALTSQVSAMEPLINALVQEKRWRRPLAVLTVGGGALLLGIPSALSFNLLKGSTLFGKTFFDLVSFFATDVLIPIGGLAAVLFVGWAWGVRKALFQIFGDSSVMNQKQRLLYLYLKTCVCYIAPILIAVVLISNLRLF